MASQMNNMPGMSAFSSLVDKAVSASHIFSLEAHNAGVRGMAQLNSIAKALGSDAQSVASVLKTNSVANQLLLPITNYPLFKAEVQIVASNLQSRLDADVSYIKEQLETFTSVAVQDITAAAIDIRALLASLYAFSQEAVDIILTSPLLTALMLLNPALLVGSTLAAVDPAKLVTNYSQWKQEAGARQSSMLGNYKSIYSFVSTALPLLEDGLLGILGQISN
ncbi:hypothetical protein GGI04_005388, partial [Coemansia thaxteri]